MRLINYDDIPVGVLQVVAILSILLKCIDGDDRLVVVIERVMVRRNSRTDALNTDGIQANKRYGKAAPHFFLKLGKHALNCEHQNAFSFTTTNQLA